MYFTDDLEETVPNYTETQQLTTGELYKKGLIQEIREYIALLPKDDQVIMLRYLNGYKFKEMSIALNIPEATCRKRKQRAMSKLKKFFKKIITILISLVII